MPEEIQQTPKTNKPAGNKLLTPVGIAAMGIIFGLLLPPLGLALALVALYKAGKNSDRTALVLSVIAALAVVAGSIFYAWAYQRHNSSGKKLDSTYSYSNNYSDFKLLGMSKGRGMSFKKPDGFTATSDSYNITQTSIVQREKLPAYSNLVTVSSIDAQIAFSSQPLNAAYVQKTSDAMAQQNSDYQAYKDGVTNYLVKYVYGVPADSVTLSTPKSFSSSNLKANAWTFDYSIKSTYDDGTARNISGKVLYALGAKDVYYFSVSSLTPNWNANSNTWDTVLKSVKIDQ